MALAGHQVDGQQPAGRHRPPHQPELLHPPVARTVDVVGPRQVDVVDHHVEPPPVAPQPQVGVGPHDLDPQRVEFHPVPRQRDDLRVDLHRRQPATRQQVAQRPHRGAPRQPQHQHRPRRPPGAQQAGRRQVVPRQPGQEPLAVPPRVDRPGHPKLNLALRTPDVHPLERSVDRLHPSHDNPRRVSAPPAPCKRQPARSSASRPECRADPARRPPNGSNMPGATRPAARPPLPPTRSPIPCAPPPPLRPPGPHQPPAPQIKNFSDIPAPRKSSIRHVFPAADPQFPPPDLPSPGPGRGAEGGLADRNNPATAGAAGGFIRVYGMNGLPTFPESPSIGHARFVRNV